MVSYTYVILFPETCTPDGSLSPPLYVHVIEGVGSPVASHSIVTVVPDLGLITLPSGSYLIILGLSAEVNRNRLEIGHNMLAEILQTGNSIRVKIVSYVT